MTIDERRKAQPKGEKERIMTMWHFRLLAASVSAALILTAADTAGAGGRTAGNGILTNSAGSTSGPVKARPGGGAGKGNVTKNAGSQQCGLNRHSRPWWC
jgi:hypothetical protein